VSISKILLNWQKKTGVYACVQCANSTQLPLQKFLKVIVCFNKVFQKSKYIFSSNSFLKMNFKPPEINILVTFRGFPLYCHLSKAHLISAFHPPPPHTSSHLCSVDLCFTVCRFGRVCRKPNSLTLMRKPMLGKLTEAFECRLFLNPNKCMVERVKSDVHGTNLS